MPWTVDGIEEFYEQDFYDQLPTLYPPCPATDNRASLVGTAPQRLPAVVVGPGLPAHTTGPAPVSGQATPSPRERVSVPSHTRAGHQPSDTLDPVGGAGSNLDTRLLDGRVPDDGRPRAASPAGGVTTT
jgi:hypothetical protein